MLVHYSSLSDYSNSCCGINLLESPNRFIPSTSGIQDKILPESGPTKTKRARKEIISPRLSAVFDKCKISNRDCVHILTAVLDAISVDPN